MPASLPPDDLSRRLVLEGEIALTFRGETTTAGPGTAVNVPANAPHFFRNVSDRPAVLLCVCAPAGQDEFFRLVGDPVPSRTSPAPRLDDATRAERRAKAESLAPRFRTEFLAP